MNWKYLERIILLTHSITILHCCNYQMIWCYSIHETESLYIFSLKSKTKTLFRKGGG